MELRIIYVMRFFVKYNRSFRSSAVLRNLRLQKGICRSDYSGKELNETENDFYMPKMWESVTQMAGQMS